MKPIPSRFTYANVVATIALFLAIGGASAFAVTQAAKNSVTSKSIKNGAVRSADVRDDSLTGSDINESSLALALAPGSDSARPTGPAAGGLVGSYPSPQIAPNAVDSARVKDESLTGGDVKDGSLSGEDISDGLLGGRDVGNDTLTGEDVQESSLSEVPAAILGGLGRSAFKDECNPESEELAPCAVVSVTLENPARMLVIGTGRVWRDSPLSDYVRGYCRIGTTSGPVVTSGELVPVTAEMFTQQLTSMGVTGVFPAGTHKVGIDCKEGPLGNDPEGILLKQVRVTAVALSAD